MTDERTETLGHPARPSDRRGVVLHWAHPRELFGESLRVPSGGLVLRRGGAPGLEHPALSREHAELRRKGAGLRVRDLGSRNGTFLDGQPVGETFATALPGATLRFGDLVGVVELDEPDARLGDERLLPGAAAATRALRRAVARFGAGAAPVLLLGETGTGKEYAARAIHLESERDGAFVAFNCAGLTPSLADSQLFGHRRGAFTGAAADQAGLFRAADGGTLFLDEVAELDGAVQSKLLRVIEQGAVVPLGSTREHPVDVRLIAATHPGLRRRIAEGSFRRDLYARLSIAEIELPPLSARRLDVPFWLRFLDDRWCAREGGEPLRWSAEAVEASMLRAWPENLRGVDRMVYGLRTTLGRGQTVLVDDLPPEETGHEASETDCLGGEARPAKPPKPDREALLRVLEDNDWSVRATAKHFQRARKQIYRWMEAHGLRPRGGSD